MANEEKADMVNHPPHYMHGHMETFEEMVLVFGPKVVADYCRVVIWKYRSRGPYKDRYEEDMEKSYWYADKLKELEEMIRNER